MCVKKNNFYYFDYSKNNPDEIVDFSNAKGTCVIANSKEDKMTDLQNANNKLLEYITAYKIAKEIKSNDKDKYLDYIVDLIDKTKNINYSAFCVYFQVCKFSYGSFTRIKNKEDKKDIIEKILDYYIENRHNTYCSYGYSDQVLQVMSDSSSSKRNSKTGITMIEKVILPYEFNRVRNLEYFRSIKRSYILPDKGDNKLFNDILREYKIKFRLQNKKNNKFPDMLFKLNNKIFILEHKLTNGSGGSQNNEIEEIIDIIEEKCTSAVSYISCLQGDYMNILTPNATQTKVKTQYNKIMSNLNKNKQNYFVNGNGFKILAEDILT